MLSGAALTQDGSAIWQSISPPMLNQGEFAIYFYSYANYNEPSVYSRAVRGNFPPLKSQTHPLKL